jgi:hypothetical protein
MRKKATPVAISTGGAARLYGHTSDNIYRRFAAPGNAATTPSLVDALRINRAKTVEVVSAIIAAAMIFSLTCSFLFGIHIVNPVPALLILVTFAGFFVMAKSATS